MSTVTIGGVAVDADDPCALHAALYRAYLRLIAGEAEVEFRYADKSVRLVVLATNMNELRATMIDLEAKCMARQGRRRRFAKGIRWA